MLGVTSGHWFCHHWTHFFTFLLALTVNAFNNSRQPPHFHRPTSRSLWKNPVGFSCRFYSLCQFSSAGLVWTLVPSSLLFRTPKEIWGFLCWCGTRIDLRGLLDSESTELLGAQPWLSCYWRWRFIQSKLIPALIILQNTQETLKVICPFKVFSSCKHGA